MTEYFPSKIPPYCNTYWDITEIRVSGFGLSLEADKVLQAHVKICKQCQAAQQNMHWTAGIVRRFKQFYVVKFFLSLWHSLASRQ